MNPSNGIFVKQVYLFETEKNCIAEVIFYIIYVYQSSLDELSEEICFIFGLKEKIGALADALKIFEVN